MTSLHNYRLYTFVANLYLSPLQQGLQTAHVVSELSRFKVNTRQSAAYAEWAEQDKTIIICGAGNHRGVLDCWTELSRINGALSLPSAIFREDEDSMNGMATACGIIVPQHYYEAVFVPSQQEPANTLKGCWEYMDERCYVQRYYETHAAGQLIRHIKGYRLA